MIVIYTNENNPGTLKIVIGAKYAKKKFELNPPITAGSILPMVTFENETTIFSPNAALKLLFSTPIDDTFCNQWLEFDSLKLSPAIASTFSSSSKVLNANILSLLKCIEDEYLKTEHEFNASDAAIWSTLYPIYFNEKLAKEVFNNFNNIQAWMKKIGENTIFADVFKSYKICDTQTAYQCLLTSAKYPSKILNKANESSPTHLSEVVTDDELKATQAAWSKNLDTLPKVKKETNPSLPVAGEKNILITSALPYVNNIPHLGNIIGCVLSADVFARFCRLCNWNTLYISGTDEYGTATETKALEEGLTPQQICDKYFDIHNSIYRWFNIGFDYFGRTTTPEQTKLVQEMFLTLNSNGFMQTQPVNQLLCEKCDRFLADRFVEGGCPHPGCNFEDARGDQCDGCGKLVNATELKNPRCQVCRSTPVQRVSEQFFLDLPKVEPLLRHWIEKTSTEWTNNAKVITKSWLREGLKSRCITRDLKWGIPVPIDGFRDKVFYVWFDAPLGYVSITQRYSKEWSKWWIPAKDTKVDYYQFMAKDNVPFHSVMFPSCLLGANQGFTTVSHIMATEYLNYEDGKFSKSRGVGVFGTDAQNTGIPSDVWRFYLLYIRPEGQDSSFSWADLAMKNNTELLNNLGNFVNRALVFTEKFFNSIVPRMEPGEDDFKVLALCTRELNNYVGAVKHAKLRDGIKFILAMSKHGNQYMQATQPWVLLKGSDDEKTRAGTVIGICCNIVYLLSTLLFPYMPETSRVLNKQLNVTENIPLTTDNLEIVNFLPSGHKIGKQAPLFAKIESTLIEEMQKKFNGESNMKKEEKKPVVEATVAATGAGNNEDVKALESEIEKQGLLVRKLKEGGAPKSDWEPQVKILLELKGKLAVATGKPLAAPGKNKKESKIIKSNSNDVFADEEINNAMANLKIEESTCNNFLSRLYKVDRDQLELQTRGQNTNNLWKEERKLRLTASNFGRVSHLSKTTSTKNIIRNMLYDTFKGNIHTMHGQTNEVNAKADFERVFNKKVIPCGLVVDKNYPFLAASPDGFVENESAIVEFKCPSVARDLSPLEGVQKSKISYCYLRGGKLKLKKAHAYMSQVQGQLHIADVDKCYFIVWTRFGMSVEEIKRDREFWKNIEPKLIEFYMEAMLPEIIKINNGDRGEIQDYYLKN